MGIDLADTGGPALPIRYLARLCRQLQNDTTTATARSVYGEKAAWTLPVQIAAATANAVRALEWHSAILYRKKGTPEPPAPEPILSPWQREKQQQDQDGGPTTQGPINEAAESGTRKFGRARMTTDEVDAWLGWTASDN